MNLGNLTDYLPDTQVMTKFNDFLKELGEHGEVKYQLIPAQKVSTYGTFYKEERMRSFYSHKNFNKRLMKTSDGYKLVSKDNI